MGVLLGNQYLAWIQASTAGTFNAIKGQGSYSENRSNPKIDTSDKTTMGYNTGAFGNTDYEGTLDLKVNLPDVNGYSRLETLAISNTPEIFQIRKNGAAGVLADAIFSALCNFSISSRTFNKDGTVDAKLSISLASAPTVDTLS